MKNMNDQTSHPLGLILERWAAFTDLSVVISDAGGFIVWVNPAFTRMCGYNSEELLGRRPGHILSGPFSERQSREVLNEAIQNRHSVQTRLVNYSKDGKPYWVDIHLEPIVDSQGRVTGYISIEKDVTKEETHQHELGELSASIYEELIHKLGSEKGAPLPLSNKLQSVKTRRSVSPRSLGKRRKKN
jgi:PAS domain S-box-containing protein